MKYEKWMKKFGLAFFFVLVHLLYIRPGLSADKVFGTFSNMSTFFLRRSLVFRETNHADISKTFFNRMMLIICTL